MADANKALSREDYERLRREIHRVQEPFIQMLVDLYARSMPRITVIAGQAAEFVYSPEVEKCAAEIRHEMSKAVESTCRYRTGGDHGR